MKKLLVVVDMQNDFINGSLATEGAEDIIQPIKEKIEEYVKAEQRVVFTVDTHYSDYLETAEGKALPIVHCDYGTVGWQIHDELDYTYKYENANSILKETFMYGDWEFFFHDGLVFYDEIEICGLVTDICVVSNALAIKTATPNSKVIVLKDLTKGLTEEKKEQALSVMQSCQIIVE